MRPKKQSAAPKARDARRRDPTIVSPLVDTTFFHIPLCTREDSDPSLCIEVPRGYLATRWARALLTRVEPCLTHDPHWLRFVVGREVQRAVRLWTQGNARSMVRLIADFRQALQHFPEVAALLLDDLGHGGRDLLFPLVRELSLQGLTAESLARWNLFKTMSATPPGAAGAILLPDGTQISPPTDVGEVYARIAAIEEQAVKATREPASWENHYAGKTTEVSTIARSVARTAKRAFVADLPRFACGVHAGQRHPTLIPAMTMDWSALKRLELDELHSGDLLSVNSVLAVPIRVPGDGGSVVVSERGRIDGPHAERAS